MAVTVDGQRLRNDGDGRVSERFGIEPPPGRRARFPELAIGAALMVAFALVAVLWHMSSTQRDPALALATAVQRGDVIEARDLHVVYLSSDERIARLGKADAAAIVGHVALADLPAGTLLTRGSVAPHVRVGRGDGVVGLALDPGQFPATELLPGDVVNVIAGPADGGGAQADERQTSVLASRAVIYAVDSLGSQGRRFISLKLPELDANRVAAAAERGHVRLVLVGQ